jgi:hypothetical protein
VTVRILDPDGVEVLVIGDNAVVDSYVAEVYDEGERTWRRITTDSPFVHGTFPIIETLDGRGLALSVVVTGPDWATITARVDALLDAVEVPGWQLEVGGKTWACRPADSTSPVPPMGTNSSWRRVSLTFPVRQARGI